MAEEGKRKLAAALEGILSGLESTIEQVPALLGAYVDGQKTIVVAGQGDYVWCRIAGNESRRVKAFNSHAGGVAQHWDLPIIIVKDKLNPNVWKVMGRDVTRYPEWGKTANYDYTSPYIAHHGGDHSFSSQAGMGADPVWVFKRQMMPLLPHPAISGTMAIELGSDFYSFEGSYRWFASTGTVDFTPALPTGAANGRFMTVYIDGNTGNPSYITGTEFNAVTPPIDPGVYISIPTASQGVPVAAVFLLTGTTRIGWGEIYDLRWPNVPVAITDHGNLGGLADDDHTQYLLLASRAGGQIVQGEIFVSGTFGIGTETVPHGGVGWAKWAMDGLQGSSEGPHMQWTVSGNDFPIQQFLGFAHDNLAWMYDSYYDGAFRSADADSNFRMYKLANELDWGMETGIAAGGAATFQSILKLTAGGVIINDDGQSVYDLRWEASGKPYGLFARASDGNIGINTASPQATFHVSGTFMAQGLARFGGDVRITGSVFAGLSSAAASTDVNIDSADRFHRVTSSRRFKEQITNLRVDSAKILLLEPRSFVWADDSGSPGMRDFGFIAEDVYEVLPELVNLDSDGKPFSIRNALVPVLLLEEVKRLRKRVDELERR